MKYLLKTLCRQRFSMSIMRRQALQKSLSRHLRLRRAPIIIYYWCLVFLKIFYFDWHLLYPVNTKSPASCQNFRVLFFNKMASIYYDNIDVASIDIHVFGDEYIIEPFSGKAGGDEDIISDKIHFKLTPWTLIQIL